MNPQANLPAGHLRALRKILSMLKDQPVEWVLTGSTGMALHGMPLPVHDIDLQTGREGAYAIQQRLAEYIVTPVRWVESELIRSHLGLFQIDGVPVELMGALQKCLADGTWEEPVRVALHRQWLEFDGLPLPVLSLEYEYIAYLKLARLDKAAQIRDWLHPVGASPAAN